MVTCSIFIISISLLGVSQGKYVPKIPTIFQSEEESEAPVHNHKEEYQWNHYSNYPPPPQYGQHESAQEEESKSWSFFPAQSAEAEPLCDDMKRKMNALLHADTFSCERLPEDVAGRILVTIVSTGFISFWYVRYNTYLNEMSHFPDQAETVLSCYSPYE